MTRAKGQVLSLLIILALSFLVYSNSLSYDFVWDDISDSTEVQVTVQSPLDVYTASFWEKANWDPPGSGYYRPLTFLSYAINFAASKDSPLGFHLTNLLFHSLNCLLMFFLFNLALPSTYPRSAIIIGSLIFAVHPVHVEAVTWISGRTDVLCTTFVLASIIFYHYALTTESIKRFLAYLGTLVCFILALHSKEMALSLPALLFLYSYCFIPKEKLKSFGAKLIHYQAWILIALIPYILHRASIIGSFRAGPGYFGGTLYNTALSMANVIAFYIRLLFLPIGQSADHTIEIATSIFQYEVLFGITLIILLVTVALYFHKRNKLIFFCILWFFIALLPVSNVIFPLLRFVGERYLYLPSVSFCLLMGYLISQTPKLLPRIGQKTVPAVAIVILAALSMLTFNRNKVWQNDLSLWTETVKQSPTSVIAHANLSFAYENVGNMRAALKEAQIAVSLKSDLPLSHYNLAEIYQKLGKLNEAEQEYIKALKLKPDYIEALSNLSVIYAVKKNFAKAIPLIEKAISISPNETNLYINLANMYRGKGEPEKAAECEKRLQQILKTKEQS